MKKAILLLCVITPFSTTITPKFFKRLRKSVTKRLKEAAYETVPLADAIRQTRENKRKFCEELEAALQQTTELLECITKKPTQETLLAQEETLESLSVTLVTALLKEKITKEKKDEINKAISQINELKEDIVEVKNNRQE